jgi:hypothetical protein
VVNPLLIPSLIWNSLKRTGLILSLTVTGLMMVETQAGPPNPGSPAPPALVRTAEAANPAQVPQGKLVLVPPGTLLGNEPPEGWTHLVLKSLPRINPEHKPRVSETAYELASLVFTTIVARSERVSGSNPPRFVLGDIGLGLGTKVPGKDMILSPDTQARLGANLGFQERIVLSECYKRQSQARAVVRTQTMAVIDTHAVMIRNGEHRLAKVRYAVLLDPRSGNIATLSWGVDVDQQRQPYSANSDLEWLPPSKIDDLVLHVESRHMTLGFPGELAFAVQHAPQGHSRIPLTNNLAALAGKAAYTPQTAAQLETTLRTEMQRIIQRSAQKQSPGGVAASGSKR